MRYAHILEQLYAKPWLITASGHASIRQLVESRLGELALTIEAKREGMDICGDAVELPQMTVQDGVAVIPIPGVIGHKLSKIAKGYGAVDVQDIEDDLDAAMADNSVRSILLDFDSPGGTVAGVQNLAEKVAAIQQGGKKKIVSFTANQMASAAYWIGSGASAIYAAPTAEVGSVGVYLPWLDQSKRYELMGYQVEIFRSGKFKGMGYPGTSLSKEQKEYLQEGVDKIFAEFSGHVKAFRPIKDADMQGQTFLGRDAAERKFIDGFARDTKQVIGFLQPTQIAA